MRKIRCLCFFEMYFLLRHKLWHDSALDGDWFLVSCKISKWTKRRKLKQHYKPKWKKKEKVKGKYWVDVGAVDCCLRWSWEVWAALGGHRGRCELIWVVIVAGVNCCGL